MSSQCLTLVLTSNLIIDIKSNAFNETTKGWIPVSGHCLIVVNSLLPYFATPLNGCLE
ncbi:hypothetical protein WALBB_1020001 [Wolbachia pipientis wAlbB]|nr:hypothetical protein WALBB_1020001 [Wolbachia pipientis wAlbB]